MKNNKELKPRSKGLVAAAWLALVMLISFGTFLTYLKFFGYNSNMEEHKISQKDDVSPAIIEALNAICDNFNDISNDKYYTSQGIRMTAKLDGTNIVVNYKKGEINEEYTFLFSAPKLLATVILSEENNFRDVYRACVYASQWRLNNKENIDSYIYSFYDNKKAVSGLSLDSGDIEDTYGIDISRVISSDGNNK